MSHTFGSIDSISVTDESIFWLSARLVKYAEISPCGTVGPIQLHGTDVCLQCIHVLILLLIQDPDSTDTGRITNVRCIATILWVIYN